MKKTVLQVFLVIGVLVIALIGWDLTLGDGGIVESSVNTIAKPINAAVQQVTGDATAKLIPELDIGNDGATLNQEGGGVEADGAGGFGNDQ